jgi:hypothetical protein
LPTPGSLNNSHLLQVFKVFEKVTWQSRHLWFSFFP